MEFLSEAFIATVTTDDEKFAFYDCSRGDDNWSFTWFNNNCFKIQL